MTVVDTLTQRNEQFSRTGFRPGLWMLPTLRSVLLGCVDPRVDPAHVLGVDTGELAVIRNVGGRATPDAIAEIALLARLTRTLLAEHAPVADLIVMQHTDCGITRLQDPPEQLADYFHVDPAALPDKHVADPRAAVDADVAALRAVPEIATAFRVSGIVYDVETGRVDLVTAQPAPTP